MQFTASLTGTVAAVKWFASNGTIDSNGLYRAPTTHGSASVTASCDYCVPVTAIVDIWRKTPVLDSISGPAMPGEFITITGKYLWYVFVAFPAPGGGRIQTGPWLSPTSEASAVRVIVPPRSASGELHVEAVGLPEQGPVISNSLHFERAPQVLVHPERSLLAAGESTHLEVAWLGAPGPLPLVYDADIGTVSNDGTYVAPAKLTNTVFAHVRACVPGPRDCSSAVLEIDPFRVGPDAPLVPAGSSLQLGVVGGAATTGFTLGSGMTKVTPDGLVTAGTAAEDSGPQFVLARQDAIEVTAEVAVTGFAPGLANRMADPVDYTLADALDGNPTAPSAQAVALSNGRAYVLEYEEPLKGDYVKNRKIWIEVYDQSDPVRPRWTGAVECPIEANYLVSAGGFLYASSVWSGIAMPVYDTSGPLPVLVGAPMTPAGGTGYFSPPIRDGERLIFFDPPSKGQSAVGLRIYEPKVDPLAYKAVTFHLPDDAFLDLGTYAVAAAGDRAYAMYSIWDTRGLGGQGDVTLGAWDIGADPAVFIGSVTLGGYPTELSIAGPLLLVGARVFDRRPGIPVEITLLPFAVTALADDANRYLMRESWTGFLYIVDIPDPTHPRISASLDPATPAPLWPRSAALNGNLVYAPQGLAGLGVYDASAAGAPLPRRKLTMGWDDGEMTTVVARNGFVYASGYGAVSSSADDYALAVWDTSNPRTKAASVQVLPYDPAYAMAFADGDRLLRGGPGGLEIWSIANPVAPTLLNSTPVGVSCIAVQGSVAWIGTLDGQLAAFDVDAAPSPVALAQVPAGGLPWAAAFINPSTLAVATATAVGGDLTLFDVSVPTQPKGLGSAGLGVQSYGVAISGSTAAVATELGLVTVDVSQPSNPVTIGLFRLPEVNAYSGWDYLLTASAISMHDGLAWVGTLQSGAVYAYDLRNPAWPRLVARADVHGNVLQTPDGVRGFAFDGSSMFVVGALGAFADILGIEVYEFDISNPHNQLLLRAPSQALTRKIQ